MIPICSSVVSNQEDAFDRASMTLTNRWGVLNKKALQPLPIFEVAPRACGTRNQSSPRFGEVAGIASTPT